MTSLYRSIAQDSKVQRKYFIQRNKPLPAFSNSNLIPVFPIYPDDQNPCFFRKWILLIFIPHPHLTLNPFILKSCLFQKFLSSISYPISDPGHCSIYYFHFCLNFLTFCLSSLTANEILKYFHPEILPIPQLLESTLSRYSLLLNSSEE